MILRTAMVILLGIMGLCPAQAQTLPAACEQYFKAADACMRNAISYYERTDIKVAKQMKEQLKDWQKMRADIHKAVMSEGEDVIAQRCTTPQFIRGMNDGLSGIMVPLTFAQALDNNCVSRYNEIQH